MKHILLAVGRLLVISASAFGIATAINSENYRYYWNVGTFQNQAVEFNILSHTLPTKLSTALIQGKRDELKRTLNSTYGLLGIVVTDCTTEVWDCPTQTILHSTDINDQWKQGFRAEDLRYYPFDYLRNPPPLLTEAEYNNPQERRWSWTGQRNQGTVIGRVYYIRTIPPDFWADYQTWLSNPLNINGAYKLYALTTTLCLVGGAIAWGILENILYRQQIRNRLAEQRQTILEKNAHQLTNQLQTKITQYSQWLTEQERLFTELHHYRTEEQHRLQRLQAEMARQDTVLRQKTERLQQWEQHRNGQTTGDVALLKEEIEDHTTILTFLKQEIERIHQQEQGAGNRLRDIIQSHESLRQEMQHYTQNLSVVKDADGEDNTQRYYQELLKENRQQTLNPFEVGVLQTLETSKPCRQGNWRVLEQMDLSQDLYHQFVDFIVLSAYCAIAVEAKYYRGEIYPAGDVKQAKWLYRDASTRSKGEIKSGIYPNPYQQVTTCVTNLNRLLNRQPWHQPKREAVATYGVIVFPEEADISSLNSRIGDRFFITRADYLVTLLEKLEDLATAKAEAKASKPNQRERLTPEQLEEVIHTRAKARFLEFKKILGLYR